MVRVVLAAFVAASLAACNQTDQQQAAAPSIGAVIGEVGFTELALPSTAYGPGSLVTSVKGHGLGPPLRLAYICDPAFTISVPIQVDAAASTSLAKSLAGGLKFSGGALAGFGLQAQAEHINSVTVKFTNVKVEQLSHESLGRIVGNLGPDCTSSLNKFRSQGIARQTQQALRADVEYEANFKTGTSAEVKNAIIGMLTVGLGGSFEKKSETSISGQGLFYGVILEEV